MCCRFIGQMNAKLATMLFLLLIGCQVFSAHCRQLDDETGGRSSSSSKAAGLCVGSPCDADPNRTCFCCMRLANEPCYDTLNQCTSACPNCNFITCPPPAA